MATNSAPILLAAGESPRQVTAPIDNLHRPDVDCLKPVLPLAASRNILLQRVGRRNLTSGCLSSGARYWSGQAIAIEFAAEYRLGIKPMQRAGHQRASLKRAIAAPPSEITIRLLDESELRAEASPVPVSDARSSPRASHELLEIAIRKRIETRLCGRVRNLNVRVLADLVILEGQCATYYTKQIAQHAAMAILEDEQLDNAIVVRVEQ
jgi:hypothetical protein